MKAKITYVGDLTGKYNERLQETEYDEKKVMQWGSPQGPKVNFPKGEPVVLDTDMATGAAEKTMWENIIKRASLSRFFTVEPVDAEEPTRLTSLRPAADAAQGSLDDPHP